MKAPEDIIISPLLSERSIRQRKRFNKVAFKVARDSNKSEIKKAIEKLFSVTVKKINTTVYRGKFHRSGFKAREGGYKPDWKKAVATLAAGDKIDLFEGT